MQVQTEWKKVKRFLKTNEVTKGPVWKALNSKLRLQYRVNDHARALNYPTVINIETTNHCNEACWFCPRAEATRGFGFVDLDLVKSIVDQSVPHGPMVYYLHKDGEPLMHPKIFDIIGYMKGAHPRNDVRLTTNGTLLSEDKAKKLLDLKVNQIRIGIRAATRETFKKVHKRDLFDRVKANIEKLIELKEQRGTRGPLIIVQIVVCEDTKDEIGLFREQWGDKPVFMEIKDFMSWGGAVSDESLPKETIDEERRPPCIDPFHNMVVNWDGKVSLCSLDWNGEVLFGNVSKQKVAEVWHDQPVKDLRDAHLHGNFKANPLCANCGEWRYVPNLFWKNKLVFWRDEKWL